MDKRPVQKTSSQGNGNPKQVIIRTQFGNNVKAKGEYNRGTSKTEPDQNKSIRQLYEANTRGLNLEINQPDAQYFDQEIPVFTDITEMYEFRQKLENQQKILEERIETEKQEKEEAIKIKAASDHKKQLEDSYLKKLEKDALTLPSTH